MIRSSRDLMTYLRADLSNMGHNHLVWAMVVNPVARVTAIMRTTEYLLNTGKPRVFYMISAFWFRSLSIRLGFSLGTNIFGPGVAIIHHGLLVVNPNARIGRNCCIHMGVHIGGSAQFVAKEIAHRYVPHIGDNVYIGPGAKLYGPIRIGDNCTIGENAVVTKSFEQSGLTIGGVPAKIIAEHGVAEGVGASGK